MKHLVPAHRTDGRSWTSTITRTQQQAMFVAFFLILIFLQMGGLFTPVDSIPDWAQALAQANPVKHFMFIMRAVLVKGAGLETVGNRLRSDRRRSSRRLYE